MVDVDQGTEKINLIVHQTIEILVVANDKFKKVKLEPDNGVFPYNLLAKVEPKSFFLKVSL